MEPTEQTHQEKIAMMLQVMNSIMDDCEANDIEYSRLIEAAESLWVLRTGKRSYNCGKKQNVNISTQILKSKVED